MPALSGHDLWVKPACLRVGNLFVYMSVDFFPIQYVGLSDLAMYY